MQQSVKLLDKYTSPPEAPIIRSINLQNSGKDERHNTVFLRTTRISGSYVEKEAKSNSKKNTYKFAETHRHAEKNVIYLLCVFIQKKVYIRHPESFFPARRNIIALIRYDKED